MDKITLDIARELVARLLKDPRARASNRKARRAYNQAVKAALAKLKQLVPKPTHKK